MFENKKILILGLARSGYAASKLLLKRGNQVYLNDFKDESKHEKDKLLELKELGCQIILGSHPDDLLDETFDYLIKNPGVPIDHKYVLKARELGIKVINEVEMCYHLLRDDITLIGITGTNGKTTTTTLTYNILKEAFGKRVHLAGNIGTPLCDVINDLRKDDILVMEVSSQQSENIVDFHPDIALMTNYSEAHIDFFKTYENYKRVKSKMFYNQKENDIAILNKDDADVLSEMKNIKSNIKYFSKKEKTDCYLEDNFIYYDKQKVMNINDIKIPGMHNVENCMGAISIAKLLQVSDEVIRKVISDFYGVKHRLEFIREINGVRFYNDTEATNIKCTQIALASFQKPTIIILGGLERGQNFFDLIPFMNNVKAIMATGECRNRVLEFGDKLKIKTYVHEHLKDCFHDILDIMEEGDVVLLSPASASWDQYKECEERGDQFRELVNKLDGSN